MRQLIKIVAISVIAMLSACHRSSGLITADTNGLTRIQLPQPEEVFVERADVAIRCIDCQPSETQRRNLVDVDSIIEQIPVSFINKELARYRFTRGSLLSIDATYYDGNNAVLRTCAGESQGCRNHVYQVKGSDSIMRLNVRFEVLDATDHDEKPSLDSSPIDTTISDGIVFTAVPSESFAPGHCVADLFIDGVSQGVHAGHYYSEVCLIAYGNQIQIVNKGIQFVATRNQSQYDLAWLAPILLESEIGMESYRPIVVGQELRSVDSFPIFSCRDRQTARFGKTSLRDDGSGRFWSDCHITVNDQGMIGSAVQRVVNFEVLSSRLKLGDE